MAIKDQEKRSNLPLYPIGIAAELVGTTDQTLRLYEKHGLVTPARRNKNRFYSDNDIKWLKCVRMFIHEKKISIEGVKKLLEYAPCWELRGCDEESRSGCSALVDKSKNCWDIIRMHCQNGIDCEKCIVYLTEAGRKFSI
ncbi:MAG: MerR family transcriptional regulator [Nitrospirota bacterium]